MAGSGQVVAERSIDLAIEELGVLAGLLGLHLGLPADVLGAMTSTEGAARAMKALQSLADRGIVAHVEGTPVVAHPVARLVEVAARPALRATVLMRDLPDGPGTRTHRVRAVPAAGVELRDLGAALRCTPFATSDVVARLAGLAGLAGLDAGATASGAPFTVAYRVLVDARRAALGGDAASATAVLAGAGVSDPDTASFCRALAGRHRVVAVHVEHATSLSRRAGGELAWLQGDGHLWRMPTIGSPFGRRDDPRRSVIGDTEVTVEPTDAATLLQALHGAVPSAPEPD